MEYRHGLISVSDETTVTSATGPLAGLIGAQRLAAAIAERKGIDPD